MPGTAATISMSSAKSAISPGATHAAAIGVDVLAEQRDFLDALLGQAGHFGQHVVQRARHFLAARVGHDAVAAVLRTAFHDRDKGGRTVHARGRQVVELLDLRKTDVHLRALLPLTPREHLGQAVQCLRAEDHVDVGRALDDRSALLAGHAASDADQHPLGLQVLDAAEVAEHLLLRLLAYRAGVEQDQVGFFDIRRRRVALSGAEHVGHLAGVVLVHLAAEGLDEDLPGRRRHLRVQVCAAASNSQRAASSGVLGQGFLLASPGVRIHTSLTWPFMSNV